MPEKHQPKPSGQKYDSIYSYLRGTRRLVYEDGVVYLGQAPNQIALYRTTPQMAKDYFENKVHENGSFSGENSSFPG